MKNNLFSTTVWDRLVSEPGALNNENMCPADKAKLLANVSADLNALLNAISAVDVFECPLQNVAESVLAFGFPCVSGKSLSSVHVKQIKSWIEESIVRFEPRILPDSISVVPLIESRHSHHQYLAYGIRGLVHSTPYPVELELQTRLDLDNGRFALVDMGAGSA
ncbi:type VI secretion system baseplate subunit TssE [Chitinibacter sp. GC72]|uniref:type VI secretion system baseplate subunit TssE n=1 Tax=Chitinibacter sp. GC72 TaxID=1526917 RepID=UPI0012F7F8EF|nr:GPW/gp25 family protein [Chitinibacter sp. GC72]